MNSQDIQNLQESYLAVYDDETRENLEFENWVNNLLDEGYDLSSYTWDEMAEIYIDEARAEGVRPYKALHLLNNKLNNFNIRDDVSIVLELNGIHGRAQD